MVDCWGKALGKKQQNYEEKLLLEDPSSVPDHKATGPSEFLLMAIPESNSKEFSYPRQEAHGLEDSSLCNYLHWQKAPL